MATSTRSTNWFAIWISGAVVVVLVVVGGIVWWANRSATTFSGATPQSEIVDAETGAIAVGSGSDTVDTYIDFLCPICNQFEQVYGPTLEELSSDGTITLNIHPIAILDRQSQGTEYSTRAANAAYCVAEDDPDAVLPFVQGMFAAQPDEGSTGLTDDEIAAIASEAGASGAASCIADGTYRDYVGFMTGRTPVQPGESRVSTPTIAVNGDTLSNRDDLTGDPDADILARLG